MTPTTPAEGYTLRDAEREMPYPMWPMSIRIRDFMRSLDAENQSLRERVETADYLAAEVDSQRHNLFRLGALGATGIERALDRYAALKATQTEEG